MIRYLTITFVFLCSVSQLLAKTDIVSTNFAGGNILIDSIVKDTVFIRPDLRDTFGEWFYWHFSVKGVSNRTLFFKFNRAKCIGAFGPAISTNKGRSWNWLLNKYSAINLNEFSYYFGSDNEVRFCVSIPYTKANFEHFFTQNKLSIRTNIFRDTLCITPKGRTVDILTIKPQKKIKYKMFFTARQHACESMASYVLEGMLKYFVCNSSKFIRDSVEIKVIPFMDIDGVEDGDQGKNRIPRDHNRDYYGESLYCSTASVRRFFPQWSNNQCVVAIDFHCPMLLGKHAECIYFYGSKDKNFAIKEMKLSSILEKTQKGPLRYSDTTFYKFGAPNNTGIDLSKGMNLRYYLKTIGNINVGTTLEIPYAANQKQMITAQNARIFGSDLGRAIDIYIQQLSKLN